MKHHSKLSVIKVSTLLLCLMLSFSAYAQTFWGLTSNDGQYGGGTIFSFNAQSNTYEDEYVFKPNPVYNPYNVFEESPNVYIGVCEKSHVNGIYENLAKGNSVYRYNSSANTTEILFTYPRNTYHSYNIGDMAYSHNKELIGLLNLNDSLKITKYNTLSNTYEEIGYFSTDNYPSNGEYSYGTSNTYFTVVNDSLIIFSLSKILGGSGGSSYLVGRDYFGYNPLDDKITLLFNVPATEKYFPYGPFTLSSDGRLYAGVSDKIMELNMTDTTYRYVYDFKGSRVEDGELCVVSDSTLVGLYDYGSSDHLFELDFKNDTLLKDYGILGDNRENAFVKRQDSLYFGVVNDQIMAYKPGGEAPNVAFKLTEPTQGFINYLVNTSDSVLILSFAKSLNKFYPDKDAYVPMVRFGGNGNFWEYKEGATPMSDLLLGSNGNLYGLTTNGGTGTYYHGDGVLFEMNPETKDFQVLQNFTGNNGGFGDKDIYGSTHGKGQTTLLEVNQKIYGTTYTNGEYSNRIGPGYGTIFTYDISRNYNNFLKIHDFNDSIDAVGGRLPMSGLTLAANGKLYGTTSQGGANGLNGHGVLYEIDPENNDNFRIVLHFPDSVLRPVDNLVLAENGKLYGLATTIEFSFLQPVAWAIREYDVENGTFTDIYKSDPSTMEKTYAQQTIIGNKLYGVVAYSSTEYKGYIYEYDIINQTFVKRVVFASNGSEGNRAYANLTLSSSGSLWGMTNEGGANDQGVIYEFKPTNGSYQKHYDFGENGGKNPYYSCLTEIKKSDNTDIPSTNFVEKMEVYPNPTTDFVKFDFKGKGVHKISYSIFDVSGKLIVSDSAPVSDYLVIDMSGFEKGVYLVRLNSQNQSFSKIVIRE